MKKTALYFALALMALMALIQSARLLGFSVYDLINYSDPIVHGPFG